MLEIRKYFCTETSRSVGVEARPASYIMIVSEKGEKEII